MQGYICTSKIFKHIYSFIGINWITILKKSLKNISSRKKLIHTKRSHFLTICTNILSSSLSCLILGYSTMETDIILQSCRNFTENFICFLFFLLLFLFVFNIYCLLVFKMHVSKNLTQNIGEYQTLKHFRPHLLMENI